MNSIIERAINAVVKLDAWDIQSVLGGVNYLVRQQAINTVAKMIPDPPPEGSGLEYFTEFDAKLKSPEIRKAVSPIVGIANRVTEVLVAYTDNAPSQYEDVLAWVSDRPPKREQYVREYDMRKRMGMRPNMPLSAFVDSEFAQGMRRHQALVVRGADAVRILESVEGSDEEAPEWLTEAIINKVNQKLEQRWMFQETRRTNPKRKKDERDLAAANQQLIESVIEECGGKKPDFSAEIEAEDELDVFIKKVAGMKVPLDGK